MDVLVRWLTASDEMAMDPIDAEEPDISDYHHLPVTAAARVEPISPTTTTCP